MLERTLVASRRSDQSELRQVRARALYVAGSLAYGKLDIEQAALLLEESLLLCQQVGDIRGAAAALDTLGMIEGLYPGNAEAGDPLVAYRQRSAPAGGRADEQADRLVISPRTVNIHLTSTGMKFLKRFPGSSTSKLVRFRLVSSYLFPNRTGIRLSRPGT